MLQTPIKCFLKYSMQLKKKKKMIADLNHY